MSVTLNATGTKLYQTANTAVDYTGITVAAGSNLALVVTMNFGAQVSNISATWDNGGTNQAMTQIILKLGSGPPQSSALFGLVAPTTGNKTLHISWTTSAELFVDAVSWNGVDQTGGATSFPNSISGTTPTVTVTSATGNMVVACEASGSSQGTSTGTLLFDDHVDGAIINAMAQYDNGAASVTIGNSGANQSIVATDVKAAASSARQQTLTLLGCGV